MVYISEIALFRGLRGNTCTDGSGVGVGRLTDPVFEQGGETVLVEDLYAEFPCLREFGTRFLARYDIGGFL